MLITRPSFLLARFVGGPREIEDLSSLSSSLWARDCFLKREVLKLYIYGDIYSQSTTLYNYLLYPGLIIPITFFVSLTKYLSYILRTCNFFSHGSFISKVKSVVLIYLLRQFTKSTYQRPFYSVIYLTRYLI